MPDRRLYVAMMVSAPTMNITCRMEAEMEDSIFQADYDFRTNLKQRGMLPGACCYARIVGVLWFHEHMRCLGDATASLLWAFVANTLFSVVSFQLMMCGCVQMSGHGCRRIGNLCGHIVFIMMTVIILWRSRFLWLYFTSLGLFCRAVWLFLSLKLCSWLGASVFQFFLFCVLFGIQSPKASDDPLKWLEPPLRGEDTRPCLAKQLNPRFNVTPAEYMEYVARRRKGWDGESP
eukprot:TRINITY_DN10200_c0_g2_i1.p1 TRINITY_DN10200_c0_g2~~TRINITY_DN10200_c0_g2_i1.p1  ORF type:complete len:233 (-),score=30.93 TRINITY_DN10200_c0_g2_i1:79-777(-)